MLGDLGPERSVVHVLLVRMNGNARVQTGAKSGQKGGVRFGVPEGAPGDVGDGEPPRRHNDDDGTTGLAEPFGEEVTLTAKKVLSLRGTSNWESAFDNIVESIKTLTAFLKKQNVTPAGPTLIVYTSTDDAGFSFLAEIPVDKDIKDVGKDMSMSQSPDGKALKFVHHGSYDNMDNTYEAITNHLDDKKLEAKDTFIEEYVTDPLKTEEDKLVINVYVPLK